MRVVHVCGELGFYGAENVVTQLVRHTREPDLETAVLTQLGQRAGLIVGYSALILLMGSTGSVLLARAIKRATFGLEPAEISRRLGLSHSSVTALLKEPYGMEDGQ